MSKIHNKLVGLLLLLLGAGMFYRAVLIIHGEIPYPMDCHVKRFACTLINYVLVQGDPFVGGLLDLAGSLLILVCGYILFITDA